MLLPHFSPYFQICRYGNDYHEIIMHRESLFLIYLECDNPLSSALACSSSTPSSVQHQF